MTDTPTVKTQEIRGEVNKFLDKLYGTEEGVVYTPTLNRKEDKWEQTYFNWPAEREAIIKHVISNTGKNECYISPSLFKHKGNSRKENLKGSRVVWAELDGKELSGEAPPPSFWLSSSSNDHLHVYWELDKFCPDVNKIEDVNKALTNLLQADASGWDANQVLRFPLTFNHKRKVLTSALQVNQSSEALTIASFDFIERPSVSITLDNFSFDKVPGNINEMAWQKVLGEKGTELFFKPGVEQGDRSTSMMALAYYMAENDNPVWNDYEMFAVLLGADEKWGKFKGRKDRNQRIIDIIVKARQKYPVGTSILSENKIEHINLTQLLTETKPVEWVIPGMLIEYGAYLLAGNPGTGKTQYTIQMAMSMACGRKYLNYEIDKPRRVMFLSLEMGDSELLNFMEKMVLAFDPEERKLIDKNLFIFPVGEPLYMNEVNGQKIINEAIASCQPEGVFVDSYSMALRGTLNDDVAVNELNAWVKNQRMKHKCFFWFVHHMRKKQQGGGKPKSMDDLYGSTFIAAGVTNAGLLYQQGSKLEFSVLKDRHSKKESPYYIIRDSETIMFGIDGLDGIVDAAEAAVEDKEEPDDTNGSNLSFS